MDSAARPVVLDDPLPTPPVWAPDPALAGRANAIKAELSRLQRLLSDLQQDGQANDLVAEVEVMVQRRKAQLTQLRP
eukprot:5834071-Alexandrium_andersonii.AAC.1